jgi:hypothetical protein
MICNLIAVVGVVLPFRSSFLWSPIAIHERAYFVSTRCTAMVSKCYDIEFPSNSAQLRTQGRHDSLFRRLEFLLAASNTDKTQHPLYSKIHGDWLLRYDA